MLFKFNSLIPAFETVLRFIGKKKIRVIDIGCGSGAVSKLLKCHFENFDFKIECSLNDTSSRVLNRAKTNNPRTQSLLGDIRKLRIKNKFDLALAVDIVEHVGHPDQFIKRISEISHFAIYKIPLEDAFFFNIRNSLEKGNFRKNLSKKYGHINFFNLNKFLKIISSVKNARIEKKYFLGSYRHFGKKPETTKVGKLYFFMGDLVSRIAPGIAAKYFSDSIIFLVNFSANSSSRKAEPRRLSSN